MQKLQWQPLSAFYLPDYPPAELMEWILDSGSFIQRLKQHGVSQPHIQVISQRWEILPYDERLLLNIPDRHYGLVREVLIHSAEKEWMYARTVLPITTLTGREKMLARLKDKSLGSMLFKHRDVWRSEFELASIKPNSDWHEKISRAACLKKELLWARRSLFSLKEKKLLLTEAFLPAIQNIE